MPSLILIHGFLGQPSDFDETLEALNLEGLQVFAPDLFRPDSPFKPTSPPTGFADFSARLTRAIAQPSSAPKGLIVGYSLGGRLALHVLATLQRESPGSWRGLLLAAHPGLPVEDPSSARALWEAAWARRFRDQNEAWESLVQDWNSQALLCSSRAPQRLEADFDRESLARAFEAWAQGEHRPDWTILRDTPIAGAVGERDSRYREIYEKLLDANQICRFDIIPSAGHRLPSEAPLALARLIQRELESLDPAPGQAR